MKTYVLKETDVQRERHVIDATDKVLGRLAAQIATLLRGKHKPMFSPNVDNGDFVVVTNAEKVVVTGKKAQQKMYYRHSNYPGGFKVTRYDVMMQTHPTRVIEHAVAGMIPHTHLGDRMIKRLKVYAGAESPAAAQKKEASVKKAPAPRKEKLVKAIKAVVKKESESKAKAKAKA